MLRQDYPNFDLTYFYEYEYRVTSPNKQSIDHIIGPKKADQWEFYEGHFNSKGDFPVELAKILNSTKDIPNKSERIKVPSNLKDLLAVTTKDIQRYRQINKINSCSRYFLYMTIAIS